jgi:3-hydroxybutyryl-CoA dehydrogenase
MKDFALDALTLGVIGAGAMGRGIAQVAATAGIEVLLYDADPSTTKEGRNFVLSMLQRAVIKGRMEASQAEQAGARIHCVEQIAQIAPADVVVEAIAEKLEIKQSLFQELEGLISPDCILASNTSSLSITSIAQACERPQRVAGFHFFNPVPLMKLVEVVAAFHSESAVLDRLSVLALRFGHTPVRVVDSPGFLVNHAGRGLNTEGLRILQEQVTDPATVDKIMRESAGFRMGPFELMDLTGLDVTCPVTEEIYHGFYQEPRLRPSPALRQRFAARAWGRKTGRGFYNYTDSKSQSITASASTPLAENTRFWISPDQPELASRISDILDAARLPLDSGERPASGSIALVTPLGLDATTTCLSQGLDPASTLAVDGLFCSGKHITLMTTPRTSQRIREQASAAFNACGRSVSIIHDSAGLIAPRIVATIINIACDIAQQGIASPLDIDTAVTLGLGYPRGPLALGDELGANTVLKILEGINNVYSDPRYRPSPWLRRRAQLGMSLLEENY